MKIKIKAQESNNTVTFDFKLELKKSLNIQKLHMQRFF